MIPNTETKLANPIVTKVTCVTGGLVDTMGKKKTRSPEKNATVLLTELRKM